MRKLVLENGVTFIGEGFGSSKEAIYEIVFNTSMVGYQEILSDSSYNSQIVCMTYPLIGNYGINSDDFETFIPTLGGFVVKEINHTPSNFRSSKTLSEVMDEFGIVGISGIDTRKLTRIIRDEGSMKAMITNIDTSDEYCKEALKNYTYPTNQISNVSSKEIWTKNIETPTYKVVALDCGIKHSIIDHLNRVGCDVTIVPHDTKVDKIKELNPDGLFLSNGPGDPVNAKNAIEIVKDLQGKLPIFGICLGHQIIALANNAKTYKLKFGHRGGNHSVKNLETGLVEITSQNHSYAVDETTVKGDLKVTHINLLDNTVEGLKNNEDKIFSVQYHPESMPGPEDSEYLFDTFIDYMKGDK